MKEHVAELADYKKEIMSKGYFTSEYALELSFKYPLKFFVPETQKINLKAVHGPLIFGKKGVRLALLKVEGNNLSSPDPDYRLVQTLTNTAELWLPKLDTFISHKPKKNGSVLTLKTGSFKNKDMSVKNAEMKFNYVLDKKVEAKINAEEINFGRETQNTDNYKFKNLDIAAVGVPNGESNVENEELRELFEKSYKIDAQASTQVLLNNQVILEPEFKNKMSFNKNHIEINLDKKSLAKIALTHTLSQKIPYIPFGKLEFENAIEEENWARLGEVELEFTFDKEAIIKRSKERIELLKAKPEVYSKEIATSAEEEIKIWQNTISKIDEITKKRIKLQTVNTADFNRLAGRIRVLPQFETLIKEIETSDKVDKLDKKEYANILSFYSSMLKTAYDSEGKKPEVLEDIVEEVLNADLFVNNQKVKDRVKSILSEALQYDPKSLFIQEEVDLYKQRSNLYQVKFKKEAGKSEIILNDKYPMPIEQFIFLML